MIRVGFAIAQSTAGWTGGANYYANLFAALDETPGLGIEPLVFHGAEVRVPPGWAPRTSRLAMLRERHPAWFARNLVKRLLDRDVLLERRHKPAGVGLISHAHMGSTRRLPVLTWIPDLQHRALPHLFSPADRAARDRTFASAACGATLLLASSETARQDIEEQYPEARGRVRVLRFVHCASGPVASSSVAGVPRDGKYLLLPNQFWAHKNHGVVVDALRVLRSSGRPVTVLCTGNPVDYRNPGYYAALVARIRDAGVVDDMRLLGLVSRDALAALMRGAVAIVNPSLFEGWSTTVEEGKALGKRVILSDIAVHREQAPARGVYFDPHDPEALADALADAWDRHDPREEERQLALAAAERPARVHAFASTYAEIAREAVSLGPRRG